jgi:hypothetical protein
LLLECPHPQNFRKCRSFSKLDLFIPKIRVYSNFLKKSSYAEAPGSERVGHGGLEEFAPYLIRGHPDVVRTEVGNHLKNWVPVFTGNPGFRLSPE